MTLDDNNVYWIHDNDMFKDAVYFHINCVLLKVKDRKKKQEDAQSTKGD